MCRSGPRYEEVKKKVEKWIKMCEGRKEYAEKWSNICRGGSSTRKEVE